MTLYNLTGLSEANTTLQYLTGTTELTVWLPMGVVAAIFVVLMLSTKSNDFPTLLMVSGFFTTSIAGMLWLAGYVPFIVLIFTLLITVVGFILTYLTGGS